MQGGMSDASALTIFAITLPGLEATLADEIRALGFAVDTVEPGGVTFGGDWPDVWRANLELRCATRVLIRLGSFMAFHLAQLDKRAKKYPWADVLDPQVPIRVEVATSRKSKIYHAGAATTRIVGGLEAQGFTCAADGPVVLKCRIDDNRVTLSVDTSGEPLHKRGHKQAVGKAPLRETLAAAFLAQCGYDGTQAVHDPMCGSGTFVLEAAEIAVGLQAGRTRSFAFERFVGFDPDVLAQLRTDARRRSAQAQPLTGSDRDAGAITMACANAERAGVADLVHFSQANAADSAPHDTAPGLVMINPPYGARIGDKKALYPVYGRLGQILIESYKGWRIGIVTSEAALAKTTGLPFLPDGPSIAHGGLRVRLYRTDVLT